MAITHPVAVRNSIANHVVDKMDAGAGAGKFVFRTSGTADAPGTEVATLTASNPAFGDANSGSASANAIQKDASATGGNIGTITMEDSTGVVVVHGVVALAGGDINVNKLTAEPGEEVSLSGVTYTACP